MNESGGPTWGSYHEESQAITDRLSRLEGRAESFATKEDIALTKLWVQQAILFFVVFFASVAGNVVLRLLAD